MRIKSKYLVRSGGPNFIPSVRGPNFIPSVRGPVRKIYTTLEIGEILVRVNNTRVLRATFLATPHTS